MEIESNQIDCYYLNADVKSSWEKMSKLAEEGIHSWIRSKAPPEYKRVSILCCLAACCRSKNKKCELSRNATVFIGKNTRRKACSLALDIIAEPKDRISLRGSSQKILWIDAFTGGIFGATRGSFGKSVDAIEGIEKCRGIEIKIACHSLCDVSPKQNKIRELQKKKKWKLKDCDEATYFEVTGTVD